MIGFYDYTVVLTYLSLVSAGLGIFISLNGDGHPYIGVFFLLFCGLCDAFDGKVARTKKDRTEEECKFGIQIDSLSDLVAFGVLPACIGEAVLIQSIKYPDKVVRDTGNPQDIVAHSAFPTLSVQPEARTAGIQEPAGRDHPLQALGHGGGGKGGGQDGG